MNDGASKPKVVSLRNLLLSVAIHVVPVLIFLLIALPLKEKEAVIPIELTFEAPEPEPDPEPPPKPPQPAPLPDPPDDPALDAVVKLPPPKPKEKKPDPPPKPKEEKKPDPPKPKVPEKTAKELREERLRKMRDSAKTVKLDAPPPVTGSGKKLDPNWRTLLNQGYKPGATTVTASESQRCVALIRRAFYEKWERPSWSSTLREAQLLVFFDSSGHVTSFKLLSSSSDAAADRSILSAAERVGVVRNLSPQFLEQNREGVIVSFKVTPN